MLFRWNGLIALLTDAHCGSGIVCGMRRANDEETRVLCCIFPRLAEFPSWLDLAPTPEKYSQQAHYSV